MSPKTLYNCLGVSQVSNPLGRNLDANSLNTGGAEGALCRIQRHMPRLRTCVAAPASVPPRRSIIQPLRPTALTVPQHGWVEGMLGRRERKAAGRV